MDRISKFLQTPYKRSTILVDIYILVAEYKQNRDYMTSDLTFSLIVSDWLPKSLLNRNAKVTRKDATGLDVKMRG